MKKKLIIILLTLGVLGGGGFAGYKYFFSADSAEAAVEEVEEFDAEDYALRTYAMENLTTNIKGGNIAQVAFHVILDSEETKVEFETRIDEMKSAMIAALASKSSSDFMGAEKVVEVENEMKELFDELIKSGKVEKVSMKHRLIQ